jgi:hypothetical protein
MACGLSQEIASPISSDRVYLHAGQRRPQCVGADQLGRVLMNRDAAGAPFMSAVPPTAARKRTPPEVRVGP